MRVAFGIDISALAASRGTADAAQVDRRQLVELARAAEASGIDRLVIADRQDAQDAAALASCILNATARIRVELEQRAGASTPAAAARQIATLDQLSCGRVAASFGGRPDEAALSHEDHYARLDEYVMLMKRLWLNDSPIDFEGRFHRLKAAISGAKPFNGTAVPLTLGGLSGTAVKVAARHADVFALPAASVDETRRTVERVRAAAACHRRADAIRFALRVSGDDGAADAPGGGSASVHVAGAARRAAATLAEYCEVGVTDFVVTGVTRLGGIAEIGRSIAPLVRRHMAGSGEAEDVETVDATPANLAYIRWQGSSV